jgi:hypothetical protein
LSPRERRLLLVLAMVGLAVAVLGTTSFLLDQWTAQDRDLAQAKRSVQMALERPAPAADPFRGLFLEPGQAASAGQFARTMGQLFQKAGLDVREFQILSDSNDQVWIRYSLRGSASAWLGALAAGRSVVPHPLYDNVGIHLRETSVYDINLEVGYARAP